MSCVVAIVGPTAMGKSDLALELCQAFDGEIVNADSRQLYIHMDIGTAKPTAEERALVPHHLVDVVYPDESFSLSLYQSKARQAVDDIRRRKKPVFLVGGSGLYAWSMIEGWRIPPVPPDPELRHQLETRARVEGVEPLYRELRELDPVAADRIDLRNVRRVIRALEVSRQGKPFSQMQGKKSLNDYLIVGLTTSRSDLYQRIDARVDGMMRKGLLAEVEGLVAAGYGFDLPSMSGLGYRQLGSFLRGESDLPSAVQQIKFDTHRFARRQYAWFRPQDKRIHWFEPGGAAGQAVRQLVQRSVAA